MNNFKNHYFLSFYMVFFIIPCDLLIIYFIFDSNFKRINENFKNTCTKRGTIQDFTGG